MGLHFPRYFSTVSIPIIVSYYNQSSIDDIVSSPSAASPLTEIDGVDATTFIEDLVFATASQDPDAGYNAMFYSKPYVAANISNGGYFAGGGRENYVYPGENTTYTFQNGTSITVDNVALLKWDFTGANTNEIFVARYESSGSNLQTEVSFPRDPADYPASVVTSKDLAVSGYYLTDDGLEDVAVLSVLSFEPESVAEFQAVVQTFLEDAVSDGKTKLVVDLSANNGGYILQAYDLYRQLFPQTEQVGYTRYRENDILLSFTNISRKLVPTDFDPDTASDTQIRAHELSYDYLYDLNTTDQHFPSFEAKFGPFPYKGSNFSALQSWDLNDPLTTVNSTYGFGIEITGYGTRTNFTQPFAAEDIILVRTLQFYKMPQLTITPSSTMASVPRPVLFLATSCATRAGSNQLLLGVVPPTIRCKALAGSEADSWQPGRSFTSRRTKKWPS